MHPRPLHPGLHDHGVATLHNPSTTRLACRVRLGRRHPALSREARGHLFEGILHLRVLVAELLDFLENGWRPLLFAYMKKSGEPVGGHHRPGCVCEMPDAAHGVCRVSNVEKTSRVLARPVHEPIDPLGSISHCAHVLRLSHSSIQQFPAGLLRKGLGMLHAREGRPVRAMDRFR